MKLLVDSGSTKADWIAIDDNGKVLFTTQTLGLNPEVLDKEEIINRLEDKFDISHNKDKATHLFFYGAGCGTDRMKNFLTEVFSDYFSQAKVVVHEDTYAAVYATTPKDEHAIVCILGRRLRALDIPFDITPGVPAFAAAAAALEVELTLPGLAQSVVLTRTSGRASAMPEGETLENFARTGATLAIHLSVHVLADVQARLLPAYGPDCPVAVVFRASWPDQRLHRATLATIDPAIGTGERTALILVGPALAAEGFAESRLYAGEYDPRYRPLGAKPRFPAGTE